MPIDYRSLPLSRKETLKFFIFLILGGLGIGQIFYDSLIVGIAISVSGLSLMQTYKKKVRASHRNELLAQFRDMLYSISSSISMHRTMAQALEESVKFWETTYSEHDYIMKELNDMVNRIKSGNEKDIVVLADFSERSGLQDVKDFVTVYGTTKKTGANLSNAIERATDIIGEKIDMERELRTLMAQKAFESRIVGTAPFIMVLFMKIMSPSYMVPMYTTVKGRLIMTIALLLMGIAVVMIERINDIEI